MNGASAQRSRHRYTYEEYLAYERDSALKHEYDDGAILAMPGGSRRHNALASRISAALEAKRKPGCVAFQSDQKVGTVQLLSGATIEIASLYDGLPD
jgi:Uma2 family endonuclease